MTFWFFVVEIIEFLNRYFKIRILNVSNTEHLINLKM